MEQKLHTPEGVRDIYNKECETKLTIQQKLNSVLHLYGYKDIQTPTFEFYDVFRKEIGSTSTQELYKFFDREGNILALRPDITPSVARAAATLFEAENYPVRLCYSGNTFINHSSYQGRLKENTQLGAELIGLDSIEADAELIAMVADCFRKVGLKEFQISIGHVDFLNSLLKGAGLPEEAEHEIRLLISNRNFFGAEEILDGFTVAESIRNGFRMLPELTGAEEVLEEALAAAPDEKAEAAVLRLKEIWRLLGYYHAQDHVTFDFSMSGSYGYYTGIVFRAYTYGTGDAVVRGGRYDNLLEKFGKNTASVGFAIIIDELMNAMSRQKIHMESIPRNLLVYSDVTEKKAIEIASGFRNKGRNIEMIKRQTGDDKSAYISYALELSASAVLYFNDDGKVELRNLHTGEEKIIDFSQQNEGA